MTYMLELEARLKRLLTGMPEEEQAIIIREMKAIALESYRNGQKAGGPAVRLPAKKRVPAARDEQ